MVLDRMQAADIDAVYEIERSCFDFEAWSHESLADELTNPYAFYWVCRHENRIVGYGGLHNNLGEGYITNIAVSDSFRRMGVGRCLLQEMLAFARESHLAFISLEVRESNAPAIALYQSFGFENVGLRKGFYQKPTENALIMTLIIADI